MYQKNQKISSKEELADLSVGVMGRAFVDFGGQPAGKATLLKVIGNTFVLNMVEALSEGHGTSFQLCQ